MKTVSVALVCCLNIGVDPPDVMKPSPCARLECWLGNAAHPSLSDLPLSLSQPTSYPLFVSYKIPSRSRLPRRSSKSARTSSSSTSDGSHGYSPLTTLYYFDYFVRISLSSASHQRVSL